MENGDEYLNRDEIFAMDDIPVEEVIVPQWNNRKILVSGMTAAGKNAYEASLVDIKGESRKVRLDNALAKLCIHTVVNLKRHRLFTESDIERLGTKHCGALELIAEVSLRLSAIRRADVEALIKNSKAALSVDSPSVSL